MDLLSLRLPTTIVIVLLGEMAGVRSSMAAVGAIDPYSNLSFRSPPPSITAPRKSLQTSFIPNFHCRLRLRRLSSVARNKNRTRRRLPFVVVDELAGQYEEGFEDVHTQLINYFTYKATRTVLNQLYEMNPPKYRWFYNFLVMNKPNDSKRFLRHLGKEKQDLAERVMITRLHLYGKWIKKCDHAKMYEQISEENLELMRERLMETVIWPSDDTNTEMIG